MGVREQLHLLNTAGHAPGLYEALDSTTPSGYVLSWDATNLGVKPSKPPLNSPYVLAADFLVSSNDSIVVAAQFNFNASDFPSGLTWKFSMVAAIVDQTGTARARLYNLTDNEYVTNGDINTTNTGPTSIQGANLIVGSAAGNLKTADKIYEVRLQTDITGEQTAALGHFGTIAFRIT